MPPRVLPVATMLNTVATELPTNIWILTASADAASTSLIQVPKISGFIREIGGAVELERV